LAAVAGFRLAFGDACMPDPDSRAPDARPIHVALVNNMPDAAFLDTEEQFHRALAPVARGPLELRLYTMPGLPRSEEVTAIIRSRYQGLDQLWEQVPDAIVITGTEPVQAQLPYESYWPYLARLLEWAAESVPVTLLSCLAAHASVLLFDGIERVPRQTKCSGVFAGQVASGEELAAGLPSVVHVPHSRVNDVPADAMVRAGYRIVVGSDTGPGSGASGWSVAARDHGERLFVLCQGHPEYSTESLLREYRRDVRRALFGRGALAYPRIPDGYLTADATETLEAFARRVAQAGPDADPLPLWETFPYEEAAAGVENSWSADSSAFYANWLGLARAAQPA
jgi:homoserine O-succinyltransferase/O-acetyltransferase